MTSLAVEGEIEAAALRFTIPTVVVASVAVILRFVARSLTTAKLGLDDFLIILSLLSFYVVAAMTIWPVITATHDDKYISLFTMRVFMKSLIFNQIFTVLAIAFAKLSLLSLYHRIFTVKTFQRWIYIVGATCIAWAIACLLISILKCIPFKASLDPLLFWQYRGQCINVFLYFVIVESVNCLQELIIIFMPLNIIQNLQLPLTKRLSLAVIFTLGGFTCVTSIVRIIFSRSLYIIDIGVVLRAGTWLHIQLSCAIIGACMPVYGSLLPEDGIFPKAVNKWDKRHSVRKSRTSTQLDEQGWLSRINNEPEKGIFVTVPKTELDDCSNKPAVNQIKVQTTFQIERV